MKYGQHSFGKIFLVLTSHLLWFFKPKTQRVSVAYLLYNLPCRCWTVSLDSLICGVHSISKLESESLRNPSSSTGSLEVSQTIVWTEVYLISMPPHIVENQTYVFMFPTPNILINLEYFLWIIFHSMLFYLFFFLTASLCSKTLTLSFCYFGV